MNTIQLDLRGVALPKRHPMLASAFQRLPAGGILELIADHDPQPLHLQFQLERSSQFSWQLVEQDGETWRVRVAKGGAQDCCGGCACS